MSWCAGPAWKKKYKLQVFYRHFSLMQSRPWIRRRLAVRTSALVNNKQSRILVCLLRRHAPAGLNLGAKNGAPGKRSILTQGHQRFFFKSYYCTNDGYKKELLYGESYTYFGREIKLEKVDALPSLVFHMLHCCCFKPLLHRRTLYADQGGDCTLLPSWKLHFHKLPLSI